MLPFIRIFWGLQFVAKYSSEAFSCRVVHKWRHSSWVANLINALPTIRTRE